MRELKLKSFQLTPILGVYTKRFWQLERLARSLLPLGIFLREADVRPHERYLMERLITSGVMVEGGRIENCALVECKLLSVLDFRPSLKIVSLDIETSLHQEGVFA